MTISEFAANRHDETAGPTAILGLTSAALYATDAEGTITFFNEPAASLWGVRPVLGESKWCGSWKIFAIDGQSLPHDRCPMAVCLTENRPIKNAEIVVERPDGGRSWVVVNPRPIIDREGRITGAVNTLVDVTDMREAEHARWKSESLAQNILERSPDCIKLLDLDGRLRSINACGCRSLEIADPADAVGLSYFDFWKGAEHDAARNAANSALETGNGRFSGSFESVSGVVTIWDEIISVLPDEAGNPTGFLVVSRDMTEHHRAAQVMARRLAQQNALARIGALALTEGQFGAVLDRATEILSDALSVPLTKVLQFADDADRLLLRAGVGWADGLVGKAQVGIERESQAGYTLLASTPIVVDDLSTETRFDGPALLRDHKVRSGMSVTIPGSGARPFGVLGVHSTEPVQFDAVDVDFLSSVANVIAARWRHEEATARRALLLREMSHRSGNLLQLASSIFQQTLRHTPDVALAKKTYSQRLAAMARTNITISQGGWSKTSIRALAEEVLEPFLLRINLIGRDLVLPADLCFDIGLIWHELSTNSAKYGSFSGNGDSVEISWDLARNGSGPADLRLSWHDLSPPYTGAKRSNGTGFGSMLLSQLAEKKHGGRIAVTEMPHYRCVIDLPVDDSVRLDLAGR